jgi:hypothetical protein
MKKTYSKEWVESQGLDIKWDFDIMDEFDMTPGDTVTMSKCDGYGFEGISRLRGKCYLVFPDNVYKTYKAVTGKKK